MFMDKKTSNCINTTTNLYQFVLQARVENFLEP